MGRTVDGLYQEVADRIRTLIGSGQFPPLSRLPAERDLAQQLKVSRPSLREALIALEIDGTVDIRMGSGVYVLEPNEHLPTATLSLGESPTELMQARLAVEGSIVMLACARVAPAFLRRLEATIEAMRAAIADGVDPLIHDRAFHMEIATQTGNAVLARIVASLFDERFSRISARISSRYENRDSWTAAVHEHASILRNVRGARQPLRASRHDAPPTAIGGAMDRPVARRAVAAPDRVDLIVARTRDPAD